MKDFEIIARAHDGAVYCVDCGWKLRGKHGAIATSPIFASENGEMLHRKCEGCSEFIGDVVGVEWRPSSTAIAEHAARALWALAYAQAADEGFQGFEQAGPGGDWCVTAGDPPARFEALGEELVDAIEKEHDVGAAALAWAAAKGKPAEEFGFELGLKAAGTGAGEPDPLPADAVPLWDARADLQAHVEDLEG